MLPEPLGVRIARFRNDLHLTLEDLSLMLAGRGRKLEPQRLNEIELGGRRVRADELVDLARVLDVAITDLLGVPDYEKAKE